MKNYKIKETLCGMKESLDALKDKFEILINILDEKFEEEKENNE